MYTQLQFGLKLIYLLQNICFFSLFSQVSADIINIYFEFKSNFFLIKKQSQNLDLILPLICSVMQNRVIPSKDLRTNYCFLFLL